MFLRWIPILFSSMYDDIAMSVYLSTKDLISKNLQVRDFDIYHSGTVYALGFWVSGLLFNVLVRCFSVKRILLICQIFMIFFTILHLFQTQVWHLFLIRFMHGICAGGVLISINILVKHNLNTNDFNKFLALNATFVYVVEGIIPIVISFLSVYSLQLSLIFLILIFLISTFTNFLNFKDVNEKESFKTAASKTYSSYWQIISSNLIFILLVVGISEALVDVLFNIFDQIIANSGNGNINKLKNLSISVVSLCSSAGVLVIPYFLPDTTPQSTKKLDWKHVGPRDKKIIQLCLNLIAIIILCNIFNPYPNNYILSMSILILIMTSLCIIHYIGIKIMHSVYYSAGCVASVTLMSETFFSAVIQGISPFLGQMTSNRGIFNYAFIYVLLIYILIIIFFRKLKTIKSKS